MKRRFDFRLARVLRVRELEEREARLVWGRAEQEARQAEGVVRTARAGLTELRAALTAARTSSELSRLPWLESQVDGRAEALAACLEEARTLRQRAERLAAGWREAEGRRRALVELEARGRSAHRMALAAADQRELDERAGADFAARKGPDPESNSSRAPR